MAGRKLTANVLVRDEETGEIKLLTAGSELPDWASGLVGDHVLEGDDESKSEDDREVSSDGGPPPLKGSGSSKSAWADYADSHDVDVKDDMSRDDIVDACRRAGVRVE